jgi:5-deoxy-glucuronate isomerase
MTGQASAYFHPRGTLAGDHRDVRLAPDGSSWKYTGLDVVTLAPGESVTFESGQRESIVVPLVGSLTVTVGTGASNVDSGRSVTGEAAQSYRLLGRESPWGVTDVLYLPVQTRAELVSALGARVALPWAVAEVAYPVQYVAKSAISSELRGAGVCSRQVNNFGTPAAIQADRLIACEVMQPGGNWSSYPPHKHDTDGDGESALEEIYYYEVAASPVGSPGFALQRVYASDDRRIDVIEEVRTGDVIQIPFGYHGPTVAAPEHDLYYLNVMAGPRTAVHPERAWLITDDPNHAWIRAQWEHEAVDGRLPFP